MLVGHEVIIAHSVRHPLLAICNLKTKARLWNNCLTIQLVPKKVSYLIVKNVVHVNDPLDVWLGHKLQLHCTSTVE